MIGISTPRRNWVSIRRIKFFVELIPPLFQLVWEFRVYRFSWRSYPMYKHGGVFSCRTRYTICCSICGWQLLRQFFWRIYSEVGINQCYRWRRICRALLLHVNLMITRENRSFTNRCHQLLLHRMIHSRFHLRHRYIRLQLRDIWMATHLCQPITDILRIFPTL